MNDFTKEELKLMSYIMRCASKSPTHYGIDDYINDESIEASSYKIWEKIQSMIDNYCEHENIVSGAYSRSNPPKKYGS